MTKFQITKVWVIDDRNLRFICNFVLGIWDFRLQMGLFIAYGLPEK
jgi:hypothetical protein